MTADHIGQVVALRQLAGREMPLHQRIQQAVQAIGVLQTATRSWPAFAPRPAALDAAIAQTDAVARSLRELRLAMASGGPDAAA